MPNNRPTPDTNRAFELAMLALEGLKYDSSPGIDRFAERLSVALCTMREASRCIERDRDEAIARADKAEAMVRRIHRCLVAGGYGSDEYATIMEAIEAGEGEG